MLRRDFKNFFHPPFVIIQLVQYVVVGFDHGFLPTAATQIHVSGRAEFGGMAGSDDAISGAPNWAYGFA